MIYDVAIIGCGVTGAMTAYYLAETNAKIAVIDAKSDVGAGTTKANSAIVHAGFDAAPDTLKGELNSKGAKMMEEVCRSLGVPYKKIGSHVVAFTEDDVEMLNVLLERGKKNNVPDLEIISSDELFTLEPSLSRDIVASLYAKSAGIVCPYTLALAAAQKAVTNGADIYLNTEIVNIEKNGDIITLTSRDGKRLECRYAVNCAGIYSDELARSIGDYTPAIIPRRGEYYILDKNTRVKVNSTIFACPSKKGKGILVAPTVHGNVIVGPNANEVDSKDNTETTAEGLTEVKNGALTLVPGIDLRAAITTFAGVRPTPDTHDFYINESESIKGLIHAIGVESPGLASAPATGMYIIEKLKKSGLLLTANPDFIPTRTKNGNIKLFNDMSPEEKAEAIKKDPSYGKIICRCETVTAGDIEAMLNSPIPPRDLDGVKRRTRSGMGRCQGGFCGPYITEMLSKHYNVPLEEITKKGKDSHIVLEKTSKGSDK